MCTYVYVYVCVCAPTVYMGEISQRAELLALIRTRRQRRLLSVEVGSDLLCERVQGEGEGGEGGARVGARRTLVYGVRSSKHRTLPVYANVQEAYKYTCRKIHVR